MDKRQHRRRRSRKFRMRARSRPLHRLLVHRSARHIYAQVYSDDGSRVVASASSLERIVRQRFHRLGNKPAAAVVGKHVARRARTKGVRKVRFDRSGFRYHGRIKTLADSARHYGLIF